MSFIGDKLGYQIAKAEHYAEKHNLNVRTKIQDATSAIQDLQKSLPIKPKSLKKAGESAIFIAKVVKMISTYFSKHERMRLIRGRARSILLWRFQKKLGNLFIVGISVVMRNYTWNTCWRPREKKICLWKIWANGQSWVSVFQRRQKVGQWLVDQIQTQMSPWLLSKFHKTGMKVN